ncbi:MAG: hypothetical protein NUV61_00755 [Candidatus Azambacteria bacterium]|nr:hypothetical protein [Candidatus Azambacteria bacterium]
MNTNRYYQALGQEKAHEICAMHGLSSNDERVVREIFSRWDCIDMSLGEEDLGTRNDVKCIIANNTMAGKRNKHLITKAIAIIHGEFKQIEAAVQQLDMYKMIGDLH